MITASRPPTSMPISSVGEHARMLMGDSAGGFLKSSSRSVMFVAGDDAAAKPQVIELVGGLGFEVVDAGPLRVARLLEAHAMLWIHLSLNRGLGRDWAFALLRRQG